MIFGSLFVFTILSEARILVVGALTRELTVKPGETYRGVIILKNASEQPEQMKIYQTDYLFFADGRNIYGEPGKLARSNATWLTFNPSRVTVPPKSEVPIHYTLKVPRNKPVSQSKEAKASGEKSQSNEERASRGKSANRESKVPKTSNNQSQSDEKKTSRDKSPGSKSNASANELLPGTYWSMLMVESLPKGHPEVEGAEADQVGVGVLQVTRYGIQIATHIGAGGTREIKFRQRKLLAKEGKRFLQIDLENTGERWLNPKVWSELYDQKGGLVGRFDSGAKKRLYPGTSVRHRLDLSKVPKGKYKALVVADDGGKDVWGAQYNLKF